VRTRIERLALELWSINYITPLDSRMRVRDVSIGGLEGEAEAEAETKTPR
jgi:hypothetical protein